MSLAAASSSSRGGGAGDRRSEAVLSSQLQWKKWKDRGEISPERTPVWTESNHHHKQRSSNNGESRPLVVAVPVVYYISRNGQLEHPHFMEIPLSSSHGLLLRDFTNRLNLLRGKCMASRYSWSAKRSYRNGYVWHDLDSDDVIQPVNGQEYVLKGSEILLAPASTSTSLNSTESSSSSGKLLPLDTSFKSGDLIQQSEFPSRNDRRRRNQSWSSSSEEYKVYKPEPNDGKSISIPVGADASTQTEEKEKQRRRQHLRNKHHADAAGTIEEEVEEIREKEQQSTEFSSREEEIPISSLISPPESDSSPETLESLMKADGRLILSDSNFRRDDDNNNNTDRDREQQSGDVASGDPPPHPSGKLKASSVLMSLISCGSVSFRDCTAGAGVVKDHGFSLVSNYYKGRLPHRAEVETGGDQSCNASVASTNGFARIALEDKEYFSGSLIETRRDEFAVLKRSSSYNADRSSDSKLAEKEGDGDGVRAMCIPRKLKITTNPSPRSSNSKQDISSSSSSRRHENSNNAITKGNDNDTHAR